MFPKNQGCVSQRKKLLLRKDLKEYCGMFSFYGKDSLLLAALAYNVGPYRILGSKEKYPCGKFTYKKHRVKFDKENNRFREMTEEG